MCARARAIIHTYKHIHTRARARTHTRTHISARASARAHTHTHTNAQDCPAMHSGKTSHTAWSSLHFVPSSSTAEQYNRSVTIRSRPFSPALTTAKEDNTFFPQVRQLRGVCRRSLGSLQYSWDKHYGRFSVVCHFFLILCLNKSLLDSVLQFFSPSPTPRYVLI